MRIPLAAIVLLSLGAAASAQTIVNNYYLDGERRAPPRAHHCFYQVCQYGCARTSWWQSAPCPTYSIVIR